MMKIISRMNQLIFSPQVMSRTYGTPGMNISLMWTKVHINYIFSCLWHLSAKLKNIGASHDSAIGTAHSQCHQYAQS